MSEWNLAPLTTADTLELAGALIVALALSAICMVGLWVAFGPEPYRENRRLSRIQHVVTWLKQHDAVKRVL